MPCPKVEKRSREKLNFRFRLRNTAGQSFKQAGTSLFASSQRSIRLAFLHPSGRPTRTPQLPSQPSLLLPWRLGELFRLCLCALFSANNVLCPCNSSGSRALPLRHWHTKLSTAELHLYPPTIGLQHGLRKLLSAAFSTRLPFPRRPLRNDTSSIV